MSRNRLNSKGVMPQNGSELLSCWEQYLRASANDKLARDTTCMCHLQPLTWAIMASLPSQTAGRLCRNRQWLQMRSRPMVVTTGKMLL
jgi:hypothetical protein